MTVTLSDTCWSLVFFLFVVFCGGVNVVAINIDHVRSDTDIHTDVSEQQTGNPSVNVENKISTTHKENRQGSRLFSFDNFNIPLWFKNTNDRNNEAKNSPISETSIKVPGSTRREGKLTDDDFIFPVSTDLSQTATPQISRFQNNDQPSSLYNNALSFDHIGDIYREGNLPHEEDCDELDGELHFDDGEHHFVNGEDKYDKNEHNFEASVHKESSQSKSKNNNFNLESYETFMGTNNEKLSFKEVSSETEITLPEITSNHRQFLKGKAARFSNIIKIEEKESDHQDNSKYSTSPQGNSEIHQKLLRSEDMTYTKSLPKILEAFKKKHHRINITNDEMFDFHAIKQLNLELLSENNMKYTNEMKMVKVLFEQVSTIQKAIRNVLGYIVEQLSRLNDVVHTLQSRIKGSSNSKTKFSNIKLGPMFRDVGIKPSFKNFKKNRFAGKTTNNRENKLLSDILSFHNKEIIAHRPDFEALQRLIDDFNTSQGEAVQPKDIYKISNNQWFKSNENREDPTIENKSTTPRPSSNQHYYNYEFNAQPVKSNIPVWMPEIKPDIKAETHNLHERLKEPQNYSKKCFDEDGIECMYIKDDDDDAVGSLRYQSKYTQRLSPERDHDSSYHRNEQPHGHGQFNTPHRPHVAYNNRNKMDYRPKYRKKTVSGSKVRNNMKSRPRDTDENVQKFSKYGSEQDVDLSKHQEFQDARNEYNSEFRSSPNNDDHFESRSPPNNNDHSETYDSLNNDYFYDQTEYENKKLDSENIKNNHIEKTYKEENSNRQKNREDSTHSYFENDENSYDSSDYQNEETSKQAENQSFANSSDNGNANKKPEDYLINIVKHIENSRHNANRKNDRMLETIKYNSKNKDAVIVSLKDWQSNIKNQETLQENENSYNTRHDNNKKQTENIDKYNQKSNTLADIRTRVMEHLKKYTNRTRTTDVEVLMEKQSHIKESGKKDGKMNQKSKEVEKDEVNLKRLNYLTKKDSFQGRFFSVRNEYHLEEELKELQRIHHDFHKFSDGAVLELELQDLINKLSIFFKSDCPYNVPSLRLGDRCFSLESTHLTFTDAQTFCRARGGILMQDPIDVALWAEITKAYPGFSSKEMWIGATADNEKASGIFTFIKGMKLSRQDPRWHSSSPSSGTYNNCLALDCVSALVFKDMDCNSKLHFLCEYPVAPLFKGSHPY